MEPSIFTRIINGEIPCHKVYEDDRTFAFMDIHPMQPGHVLVVSKQQVDHFEDLAEQDYLALWSAVRKVARAQKNVFQRGRIGVHVVGLDLPHAHVHVLPFDTLPEYLTVADQTAEPNHAELAEFAAKLAKEIAHV